MNRATTTHHSMNTQFSIWTGIGSFSLMWYSLFICWLCPSLDRDVNQTGVGSVIRYDSFGMDGVGLTYLVLLNRQNISYQWEPMLFEYIDRRVLYRA